MGPLQAINPFYSRMLLFSVIAVVCGLSTVSGQRVLALPDPKSCSKRVKHAVWTDPLVPPITTSSAGCTNPPPNWKLTGSTLATSADVTAWTLSVSKLCKKTNSSSNKWLAMVSNTSGPVDVNVILTDATVPICSPSSSTDGSGPDPKPRSHPPISALSETGPTPEVTNALNQTTAKMMKENLAWPS